MGRAVANEASRWKVAGASVIGKQHEATEGRCEDAWCWARRLLPCGHEAVAACVCDGAGSAANGWVGAQIASRFLVYWLVNNIEKVFSYAGDKHKQVIVSAVKRQLRRLALREKTALCSYACTVVAALTVTDGRWLIAHLGDGAIVGSFGGELRIVSAPRKGEFANETFFVTDDDAAANIDIQSGGLGHPTAPPEAFALFTDGVEGALINRHTGEVSRVLARMFDWLRNFPEADVCVALENNLTDVFRQRSSDDCSLVLIVQKR